MKAAVYLTLVLLVAPAVTFAHPGRTDASGCHTNKKTGEYHCHGTTPDVRTPGPRRAQKLVISTTRIAKTSIHNKRRKTSSSHKEVPLQTRTTWTEIVMVWRVNSNTV